MDKLMCMKAYRIGRLEVAAKTELETLYRQTREAKLRTRVQMVLLSSDQGLTVQQIAAIVRESPSTVLRCLKQYSEQGVNGLYEQPRPGRPRKGSQRYWDKLLEVVRVRPRSLGLAFSTWTLDQLVDYLETQTGERVSGYTVWRRLGEAGIVFSRPQHTITSPDPEYQLKKRRLKPSATT